MIGLNVQPQTSAASAASRLLLLASLACFLFDTPLARGENWSQFRGPRGDGVSKEQNLPAAWTAKDVKWNVALPGIGHASPVNWGDLIFVTSAAENGTQRQLFALDRETGERRWMRAVELHGGARHLKNSYASSTPAADDERVYVMFADDQQLLVSAFNHSGDPVWQRSLGPYESQHGVGASPIVFEDLLIVPNDQDGPSSIIALDRRSGENVWKVERAVREVSYATPLLLQRDKLKPQLICVAGATGLTSFDPWSGKLNWYTHSLPKRTVGTPVYGAGMVIATCGQGFKGNLLVGVEPDGSGDVEATRVKLRLDRGLPYVPSPVVVDDLLYLWGDTGVVICLELPSGNNLWQQRVGGAYSGSPIAADGKLYNISEQGDVVALQLGREFKQLGTTPLDDNAHATLAITDGHLLVRSFHQLRCIVGPKSRQPAAP